MRRRGFMIGTGLALGGTLAGVRLRALTPTAAAEAPRIQERALGPNPAWAAVKAEFALTPGLAHMAGFFLASHPRSVRNAIDRYRRGLDDNPLEFVEQHVAERESAVREAAAAYGGGSPDDYAMTDSTTMGLGMVYGGLKLAPGQEILSTTHDHICTTLACQHRADRSAAPFRRIALYEDPATVSADAIVSRTLAGIRPNTRVLALTWVHSGTGVKLPIRAIADRLAELNAKRNESDHVLMVVDGVHGFGIDDEQLPNLGCDFFVAGCHKWIFGPRGTGLIWGRRKGWAAVQPTIPSMDPMWRKGPPDQLPGAAYMTPGGFHSFEHRWALDAAFRFHLQLGKARVAARIHALNQTIKEELGRMKRVKVVTPMAAALSAGIVCFSVDGMNPAEVVARLRKANVIATVTPPFYEPAYVRLSAGLITVESDVKAALAAVRALG
jgi:isopenicillin-N epimerase